MSHLRRLLGFGVMPLTSLIAPLVLLPVVAARYGEAGWSVIALGQSIGAVVSVVVALAWPIVGGHQIALADHEGRSAVFRRSVASRLLALAFLLPPAAALSWMLAPALPIECVAFMVGIAFNGLTAAWYHAGTGRPKFLVLNEGAVRAVAYVLSAVVILLGAPLMAYAVLLAAAGPVMLALNWHVIVGRMPALRVGCVRNALRIAARDIADQLSGTFARLSQAVFAFSGSIVFSLAAPGALSAFAAADQVAKAATNAAAVVPQSFVSWVAHTRKAGNSIRLAFVVIGAILLGGLATWLVVGPNVLLWLFDGGSKLDYADVILIGLAVCGSVMVQTVELLVMVPRGRERLIYRTRSIVSVVSLVCLVLATAIGGVFWALLVFVLASTASIVVYLSSMLLDR